MHIVHIILWQISFWRWSSLVMLTHWSCFTFWLYSKNLWKNIQGQNSKYFFFFPLRKMMLLVRHRWPIFHFPWCCYPLSGGYLLQPKICIIPLFFKITDLHLHTLLENLKLCPKILVKWRINENEGNEELPLKNKSGLIGP